MVAWGTLFAVPPAVLGSGHLGWAIATAYGSIVILAYEYQGAEGFPFLPGMLSVWLLTSSGGVYAVAITWLLRRAGLGWLYVIPIVGVAVVVGGYVLVRIDPWLRWLYLRFHPKPPSVPASGDTSTPRMRNEA
jgi:hypothetical protein